MANEEITNRTTEGTQRDTEPSPAMLAARALASGNHEEAAKHLRALQQDGLPEMLGNRFNSTKAGRT